jgi:hypothetical protein
MSERRKVLLGKDWLPVVWSERRDDGGMFDAEVGVAEDGARYVAYVTVGWGSGVRCTRDTEAAARGEIDRLWNRLYGDGG